MTMKETSTYTHLTALIYLHICLCWIPYISNHISSHFPYKPSNIYISLSIFFSSYREINRIMSTNIIYIVFLVLVLLFSPAMSRHLPILQSAPSTALPVEARDEITTPFRNHRQQAFHREAIKNCMPKGSRRSSAPSRYVNYHILGSSSNCSGSQLTPPPTAP